MIQCNKCGREIEGSVRFCPYCGEKIKQHVQAIPNDDKAEKNIVDSNLVVKKMISKQTLLKVVVALLVAVAIGTITLCEIKISNAKALYAQGEYFKASSLIRNIPTLGREEVSRIKIAGEAGWYYESYLTTKRIRLSSTSSKSQDAYQDAFFDLLFGLHLDLRWSQGEELNDIERSEYQKFIDLFHRELKSMFFMSDDEIATLMDAFASSDKVADMHTIANEWLEENFFD